MGRKTFKKIITSEELLAKINPENKKIAKRFIKEKNTRCSEATIKNYKSDLNIFFTWNLLENDNKFFINIKKLELADFFSYAVDDLNWGSARFSRMRSCLSSLSEFLEKFYDEEYPNFRNIVLKSIELMPKAPRRKKTILSEEQINTLMEHLSKENKQQCALLALAISSGARKSELLRFDLNLIDEDNTAFDGLFIETKEPIKTKGFSKEGKMLYKYIIKDLFLPHYHDWLQERAEIMKKNNMEEHNKLFIKSDGTPITTAAIDGWVEKWSEYLKEDVYMHAMRHYMCTYLSKCGMESELVVEIFGWSSHDMYNIYNDLTAKDKKWKGTTKLKEYLNKDKQN